VSLADLVTALENRRLSWQLKLQFDCCSIKLQSNGSRIEIVTVILNNCRERQKEAERPTEAN